MHNEFVFAFLLPGCASTAACGQGMCVKKAPQLILKTCAHHLRAFAREPCNWVKSILYFYLVLVAYSHLHLTLTRVRFNCQAERLSI